MRFSPEFLDDLKSRLPVSEVVGRRVKLKKAGREWKGLSPFGKEKTPSFFVNDQKQAWFDFSFTEERQHLRLPDARPRAYRSPRRSSALPRWRVFALPRFTPEAEAREERRKTLHDVVEIAAKFFEATLQSAQWRQGARLPGGSCDRTFNTSQNSASVTRRRTALP